MNPHWACVSGVTIVALLVAAPSPLAAEPFFQGLGFLPDTGPASVAYAVSGDGKVVVGQAGAGNTSDAVRWTLGGAIEKLGPNVSSGCTKSYAWP